MHLQLPESPLALRENAPLRLRRGRGGVIRGVSGTVWVTAEGLADDIFLAAGDVFPINTDGLVLVEALGDASISVLPPANGAAAVVDVARLLAGETADRRSG